MDQAGLSFSLCFLCSTSEYHVASHCTCTTCTGKELEGGGDSKIQYNVQSCHTAEIIVLQHIAYGLSEGTNCIEGGHLA